MLAGNVVSVRTTKPVLQCVKLTAVDDRLTLSATDSEVAIRYSDSQVQVEEAGETLVPVEKFRDIVRESMDDTMSIDSDGECIQIRGQDSHFKIFTQNTTDFPAVSDFDGEADFKIQGGLLKQLIGQTKFAVAKESTRYAFNGVLITAKGKKVCMVSTDGRRLSQANGNLVFCKGGKDGFRAIVPIKTLTLIEGIVNDPEEEVSVRITDNQIIVHTSNATLTSNLVEGQFPPFEDVIPKDGDKKMEVAIAELTNAVKRAALLTTESSGNVRFAFGKKGLVISSRSPDAGEATVNLPCKFEGEDIEIGFNAGFLIDALKVAGVNEVTLEMSAPNRPGLLRGGPNFLYVIMPVNLQ